MARIPILSGIFALGRTPDFRIAYPVNLLPTIGDTGLANGYLRPAEGLEAFGSATFGNDRGGIEWDGTAYRVLGSTLTRVNADGSLDALGDVGWSSQPARLDYSFDRLAIASNGQLFYWRPTHGLQRVTDPDLGVVRDMLWVDGYFMTTTGTHLVVTELADPFAVNPLRYGSSEIDPDALVALLKLRNEVYAVNRHTVEVFNNTGGAGFPFQRVEGGMISKGAVGTRACCVFLDHIALVGGGRNEAIGVYLAANAQADKISTSAIDAALDALTPTQLANIFVESRITPSRELLYLHLPKQTLVFDRRASSAFETPVWFVLKGPTGHYPARGFTYAYGRWLAGDSERNRLCWLTDEHMAYYGERVDWEFSTRVIYNEGADAIVHSLELVTLPGRGAVGRDAAIATQFSHDGVVWSMEAFQRAGAHGERTRKLIWRKQGTLGAFRIQKFKGTSDAFLAFVVLQATLEGLT